MAAGCGGWAGDCSCDWAGTIGPGAVCAFRRFGLVSEAAIRNPPKATIGVDRAIKFVSDTGVTAVNTAYLLMMRFPAF